MSSSKAVSRRKTKYIHVQRHKASCGPVAIANVIKWFGISTSYDRVLRFCLDARAYDPEIGMWPFQMWYVLKTFRIPFKVHKKFTIEKLDSLLDNGGVCILVYDTRPGRSHVVFIDGRNDAGYRSWNRKKGMLPFFPREEMDKTLRESACLYVYTFQSVAR